MLCSIMLTSWNSDCLLEFGTSPSHLKRILRNVYRKHINLSPGLTILQLNVVNYLTVLRSTIISNPSRTWPEIGT